MLVVTENRLNPEAEPRIKHGAMDDPPKASHPFFWAGYMLVDTGTAQTEAAPPEATGESQENPKAEAGPPDNPPAKAAPGKRKKRKPAE